MTARVHPFPSRTRKLSSRVPTILTGDGPENRSRLHKKDRQKRPLLLFHTQAFYAIIEKCKIFQGCNLFPSRGYYI